MTKTKTKTISFGELRRLLGDVGFKEKRHPSAMVFQHAKEGLLVFRLYKADERVDERDLVSARKFPDFRGLMEAADFDASFHESKRPA